MADRSGFGERAPAQNAGDARGDLKFNAALKAMENGAPASLSGLTLTVNGIALAITDEQFDIAWDAMGDPEDAVIGLADDAAPGTGANKSENKS